MIKEWFTEVIHDGKRYRVHHTQWDYYGGSTISDSRMVLIEDETQKVSEKNTSKNEESILEREKQ